MDQRDNRGKKQSLPLALMGVVMALLAGRDGNLPAIQRHMKNHFDAFSRTLTTPAKQAISRAQLPRLLARVNYTLLAQLVQQHYGFSLPEGFPTGSVVMAKNCGDPSPKASNGGRSVSRS